MDTVLHKRSVIEIAAEQASPFVFTVPLPVYRKRYTESDRLQLIIFAFCAVYDRRNAFSQIYYAASKADGGMPCCLMF